MITINKYNAHLICSETVLSIEDFQMHPRVKL